MYLKNRIFKELLAVIFLFSCMAVYADSEPLLATVNYVDANQADDSGDGTSWATAKKTIQAAVNIVANNGTVWVTNGIYNTGGAIAPDGLVSNRVCITRPITIRSMNGAESSTIVADSMRGVYLINGGVLSGFTITGGFADNADGGGVYLYQNGELNNCTVSANGGSSGTGGVSMNGGELNNCIVWNNGATNLYSDNGTVRNSCSSDGVVNGVAGCLMWMPRMATSNSWPVLPVLMRATTPMHRIQRDWQIIPV